VSISDQRDNDHWCQMHWLEQSRSYRSRMYQKRTHILLHKMVNLERSCISELVFQRKENLFMYHVFDSVILFCFLRHNTNRNMKQLILLFPLILIIALKYKHLIDLLRVIIHWYHPLILPSTSTALVKHVKNAIQILSLH